MTILPQLQGSEKQIAWATDLRAALMVAIERLDAISEKEAADAERAAQRGRSGEAHLTLSRLAREARDWLPAQTDARFWIDLKTVHKIVAPAADGQFYQHNPAALDRDVDRVAQRMVAIYATTVYGQNGGGDEAVARAVSNLRWLG